MTISPWIIYFASMADTLNNFFIFLIGMAIVAALICLIMLIAVASDAALTSAEKKLQHKYFKKKLILSLLLTLIFSFLNGITPSTKTCYEMFIIPKIVNSKLIQNMPVYIQQYIEKEIKNGN